MSVEPGLVDANVLVYAFDTESPKHIASRNLLEAARAGTTTLYVTSQVLCEFYAIVTNPRRSARPRSVQEAILGITGLLSFLHVLPMPATTVEGWLGLLRRRPVTGGQVFDLQIVSTMLANHLERIYTFNIADFEPFIEIKPSVP